MTSFSSIKARQGTHSFPFIFLVVFLILSSFVSYGQRQSPAYAVLTGIVRDPDGQPLPYATVSLGGDKNGQTDEKGRYLIKGLSAGTNVIRISLVGYQTDTKNVELYADSTVVASFILQPGSTLSEIVVTAGRKAESINEVPSSVSILTARDVKEQLSVNPSVAAILGNTIPGLGTATNKATNSGQTLRGRQVLVLIDGIPQSTPLMNGSRDIRTLDPSAIERVEVIKGATSIYGNGSAGGIINFITKKPASNRTFAGTTNLGINGNLTHPSNTGGYRLSQSFSGTLNKFSYLINGTINYTGVLKDANGKVNAQPDGLGENSLYNTFIKLGYQPNDNSQITASYNLFRSVQSSDYINVTGKYNQNPSVGAEGESLGEPAGTPYNHNVLLSYQYKALPLATSLDASVYYNGFISMNRYVEKASSWYGPGQTKIQSFKKGLRLTLNTPWKLAAFADGEVTYGLDLLNDRTNQVLTDGRVYIPDMNMVNLAPYAQMKVDLFTDIVLKAGLRYENATVKVKDFNTIAKGPNGAGSIAITGGEIPFNATTFNAGLRYKKFPIFNPFISFSQGFAINELGRILRSATSNTLENIATDPIITNNYEAGFSSRIGIMNFTAAYYISTSKLGANLVDVGGYLVPQRKPERVYGYELTANAYLSSAWTLGASYSFVEGKAENEDGTKVYMNGLRIAPPKATAYLAWRPNTALDMKLFYVYTGNRDRFDVRSTGLYANSEGPVKSVSLFNFSTNYKVNSRLSAGLGVENLLNSSYYPVVSQYRAMDAEYVQGNGATVSLNVFYTF